MCRRLASLLSGSLVAFLAVAGSASAATVGSGSAVAAGDSPSPLVFIGIGVFLLTLVVDSRQRTDVIRPPMRRTRETPPPIQITEDIANKEM